MSKDDMYISRIVGRCLMRYAPCLVGIVTILIYHRRTSIALFNEAREIKESG